MQLSGKSSIGYTRGTANELNSTTTDDSAGPPPLISASDNEIQQALSLASSAFPAYRKLSGVSKADFLRAIGVNIKSQVNLLITLGKAEAALTAERIRREIERTVYQLQLFADLVADGSWVDATLTPSSTGAPQTGKPDLRSMLQPLGPVVVFPAGNFPLAYSVAGGDTASALAAGCPVIVKAHPAHPRLSEVVADCVTRAAQLTGMPEGVFSMLYGEGYALGETLVSAPEVKAVGFTGSLQGGRAIMDIAAKREHPIPVFAEMGSTNPVIFTSEALSNDLVSLCSSYTASLTQEAGQFCTNPGLVFLPEAHSEAFSSELTSLLRQIEPATMLNQATYENYQKHLQHLLDQKDVTLLSRTPSDQPLIASPCAVLTSAMTFLKNESLHCEIFGPAAILVTYRSDGELAQLIDQLSGQLTATLHCPEISLNRYETVLEQLSQKAGRVILNGFPTGVEVNASMVHGGPYPASSDSRSSSVGPKAIFRFARPVCYQNFPQSALPEALQDENPLGIQQKIHF